jgi:hypothetical protein
MEDTPAPDKNIFIYFIGYSDYKKKILVSEHVGITCARDTAASVERGLTSIFRHLAS